MSALRIECSRDVVSAGGSGQPSRADRYQSGERVRSETKGAPPSLLARGGIASEEFNLRVRRRPRKLILIVVIRRSPRSLRPPLSTRRRLFLPAASRLQQLPMSLDAALNARSLPVVKHARRFCVTIALDLLPASLLQYSFNFIIVFLWYNISYGSELSTFSLIWPT